MEDKKSRNKAVDRAFSSISITPRWFWALLVPYSLAALILTPVTLSIWTMQQAVLIIFPIWFVFFILTTSSSNLSLKVINVGLLIALSMTLFFQPEWVMPEQVAGALGVLLYPFIWLGVWIGPVILALLVLLATHIYIWVAYTDWLTGRLAEIYTKDRLGQ